MTGEQIHYDFKMCLSLLPWFGRLHQRPPIFKSMFVASPSFSRVPPSLPCQWSSSTATTWTTMPVLNWPPDPSQLMQGGALRGQSHLLVSQHPSSFARLSWLVTSWVLHLASPNENAGNNKTHLKCIKARFCWEIKKMEYKTSLDSCIHFFMLGPLKCTSWLDPNPIDQLTLDKCAIVFFSCPTTVKLPDCGTGTWGIFHCGFATGKSPLWSGPISNIREARKLCGSSDQRKTGRELYLTPPKIWNHTKNTSPTATPIYFTSTSRKQSPSIVDHHSSWLNQACFWRQKPESLPGDTTRREWSTFPKQKPTAGRRNTMQGPAKCTSGDGLLLALSQSLHQRRQVRDSTPRVHRKRPSYTIYMSYLISCIYTIL